MDVPPSPDHEIGRVVAIGGGAGSAPAFEALFRGLRRPPGTAFVVMAHRDDTDEHQLAVRLQAASDLVVAVARPDDVLVDGQVHVLPPGFTVEPVGRQVFLRAGDGHTAPIDRLLRAVAGCHGRSSAGIVLSGPGADGMVGLKYVKEAGGLVAVQDPGDADDESMPRSAIASGLIDLIVPLAELPRRLTELLGPPDAAPAADAADAVSEAELVDLLELVHARTGHDFGAYRRGTLLRRLARRMHLARASSIAEYQRHAESHPLELSALLRDFLVSVTNFFRDREVFQVLATSVLPRIFVGRQRQEQVRIWVPGCATGEEAYSLAMLAAEHAAASRDAPQIQIFATDIDEESLALARNGRYPDTIAADVSPDRLARFFVRDGAWYRVRRDLRELVLFSAHDVLRDPPFSRLDLVSCRNLLIYLQREAQERLLGTFELALRPDGVLVLGSSEAADHGPARFAALDAPHRIFVRRALAAPRSGATPMPPSGGASHAEPQAIDEELRATTAELATSREELQALNEELMTLDRALRERVDEISDAHADLGNLIAATDMGVVFLDRLLHVKRFTPRARDFFNLIDTDVGRPLAHLTHRLGYPSLLADVSLVARQGHALEREVRGTAGGRYLVRLSPYRGTDGAADGVVLTVLDVTALRASEHRFHLALRTAPVMMFTQDPGLRFTWAYVHGREVDLAGKTDHDVFAPAEAEALTALGREVLETGEPRRRELRLTMDGVTRDYEVNVEPTAGELDSPPGVAWAAIDVTERKAAAAQLRDDDRRKDEFLATVAHELRNPLTPLRGALELMRRAGEDRARTDSARAIIERQVEHLTRLVDDVLEVSRVSLGEVELQRSRVALADLIAAAIAAARPLIDAAGHTLAVELPPERVVVEGDRARLVQALTNLLASAAQHAQEPGRVHVRAAPAAPGRVAIEVQDDGPGLDPTLLPHVFDVFAHPQHGRARGRLGLALVQRLVKLHGGAVHAHSEGAGSGTRVVVELPVVTDEEPDAEPAAGAPPPRPAIRPRRVLLVDDNDDITSTTAELLRFEGYEVETAADGPSALALVEAERPDAVVLDLGLPGMSGYEVARALRRRPDGACFRIVAMSGWGQARDQARSREAGIDRHLVKPVDLPVLLRAIEDGA